MAFLFSNFKDWGLSLKIVRLKNWKVGRTVLRRSFVSILRRLVTLFIGKHAFSGHRFKKEDSSRS